VSPCPVLKARRFEGLQVAPVGHFREPKTLLVSPQLARMTPTLTYRLRPLDVKTPKGV
jgi:hypothetical protein